MPETPMTKTWMDAEFRPFYTSQFVKDLWNVPRWTVTAPKNKMPIDIDIWRRRQKVSGALATQAPSLDTLQNVCHLIPDAVNNTFYLDCIPDKYVVLDIEPECPSELREKFLNMPYIYAETSMSGKGLHLVFPLPEDIFRKYPVAQTKVVMKEKKYYEIMLCHYITFTRNHIPVYKNPNGTESFEKLFESMCSIQVEKQKVDIEIDLVEAEKIPAYDDIIGLLLRQTYSKTPVDFENDMSRYEFGHLGFLHSKLLHILECPHIKSAHVYTDSEKATLIYIASCSLIPYRPKHDSTRSGMPFLLWRTQNVMALNTAPEDEQSGQKKE